MNTLNKNPDRPLRVAWISDFPVEWLDMAPRPWRDAPRRHPMTWMQVLRDELDPDPNIELHICALDKRFPKAGRFDIGRTHFHIQKPLGGLRASTHYWLDTCMLRRTLKKIQPDVVHAWGTEKGAASVASRLKYPGIVTIQGLMNWYLQTSDAGRYIRFNARIEKKVLPGTPMITAESRFAIDWLQENLGCGAIEKVQHAPARHFFEIRRNPDRLPATILYCGTLDNRKGADVLAKALGRMKSGKAWQLRVITGSPQALCEAFQMSLSPYVRELVSFEHNLPPQDVARAMSTATIMVHPCRADNSPNSVKEAAVMGLPVVASRVGGIPEIVEGQGTGLLCKPGDADALAKALEDALEHPLFGEGQVAPEAHEHARTELDPGRMAAQFKSLYRRAAGVGAPGT